MLLNSEGCKAGLPIESVTFQSLDVKDVEEEMSRIRWGGIKLGEDRVYILAYADNMVLLAANEEEMRSMVERLEEYLERKRLELNTEKSKMMRVRRGSERLGKRDWRWKGKRIEEVKEFKYLVYVMQRNGDQKA